MSKPSPSAWITLYSNPWCCFVSRTVDTPEGPQPYFAVEAADYLGIVARTPKGLFPLVYQTRPVVEMVTCELPAGTVEAGETAKQAAIRELKEETGLEVKQIWDLGSHFTDSGRLRNQIHSFLVETSHEPDLEFIPEPGMRVEYVDQNELVRRALCGELHQLLHVGTVFMGVSLLSSLNGG